MLKQRLSPLIIVVLIAVALAIIAGAYFLFMHRSEPAESEAPAITNDPYASQYSGPPTKSNPEAAVAP